MECTPNVLKFKQQFGTELKRSVHLPTYFKDMEMIGKPFLCTPPKQITFESFFQDNLLQTLWLNFRTPTCSYTTYSDLVQAVRFTERDWNPTIPLTKWLKHVSFSLNADINLIQCMHHQASCASLHQCPRQQGCRLLKYQFLNPLVKLILKSDFFPITLMQHKKKLFLVSSLEQNLVPFLINLPRSNSIVIRDHVITQQNIRQMLALNQEPMQLGRFSIGIYTAFGFVTPTNAKVKLSLIGWHQGTEPTVINIFVSPAIGSQNFKLSLITDSDWVDKNPSLKNMFNNPHLTEGHAHALPQKTKNKEGSLLNQNYCVCEHHETQHFTVPGHHTFKPLGKPFFFFLSFFQLL